jgi:50S ribosomal subunit-associated GTPase HflX
MLSATEKTFMSNGTATVKTPGNWTQLNRQLAQAKTLLRQIRQTVEDIEDARTIERATRAHGSKPRIPWAQVKRELQLD